LYSITESANATRLDQTGLGSIDHVELEATTTTWGAALRAPFPGRVAGLAPAFAVEAGPLGRHEASWVRDRRQ